MILRIFLIFLFSFQSLLAAEPAKQMTKEEFEQARWNKIHKLISEEINTIEKVRKKNQTLQYRLFELKSELVKLYKEKENKKFMALKLKHGKKIKREDIFKMTLKLYKEANKYGLNLLKKYPNTSYKAAIYYTLALNSRDFSYDEKELNYLRSAIEYSGGQNKVNYLARTSLGEYYYNQKNWKGAIYQYEIVIKNQDDEWYTKNMLNYGWCQLKEKNFAVAINSLEKSYTLSKDEFYVDVREQAMTGLISFYVLGQEIERGIKFIDKHASDKEKNDSFLKLAQKASGKGYYKETQKIIDLLEDRIDKTKEIELYSELKLFEFDVYKQYHKPEQLMKVALTFRGLVFTDYQREEVIRKISDVVGAKQVILKKDFSKQDQTFDRKTLNEITSYFDTLSIVDKSEKAKYEYYKAETYYSINLFKEALANYKISLKDYENKLAKDDLRLKNIDAMFSCIELIDFKKKEKANELEFAYNKYLEYWPTDKKAQEIYPRLFGIYLVRKDFDKMQLTIDRYLTSFPKDLTKQQDLYRVQLDLLIKNEKTELLAGKISQMQKGYLSFSNEEVKKSETILANILFNSFKKLNEAGNSKDALLGYQKVHFTDYYPKSIKAEAAFNMGMIYTDQSDHNNALKWYQKSFVFYTEKEIDNKREFLEKMSLRTTLLHDFLYAAKIDKFILKNYCNDKEANQKVFTSAIRNDLANDYISKAFYTYKIYTKCISKVDPNLNKEVLIHLFENKHEKDFLDFARYQKMHKTHLDLLASYLERLYWRYFTKDNAKRERYLKILSSVKTDDSKLLTRSLKLLDKLKDEISKFSKVRISINKKKPDPDAFISQLQIRLKNLEPIINNANDIFTLGHGKVSIMTYDELTRVTAELSDEILQYDIPINDKDFQKQFKTQMTSLSKNIKSQSLNYLKQSQELIEKYEILTEVRKESHPAFKVLEVSDITSQANKMAVPIELGE